MTFVNTFFSSEKGLVLFLLVLLLYHFACMFQPHMGLFYDEAYYAHWAESFSLGYYSKPPVVAWVIKVTTSLFGNTDWSVKLGSPILYTASSWIVFKIGNHLFDKKVGLLASLIFASTPIIGFNSLFITTDAPLLFFWSLSVYLFLLVSIKDSWQLWMALGVSIGLGMLSKYTFFTLPLGFVLYVFLVRDHAVFINSKAWCAALLACAIFSLNMYWNSQHDFISLLHTREIAKIESSGVKILAFFGFIFSQIAIFGILVFVVSIFSLNRISERYKERSVWVFLVCITLPILALVSSQALFTRAFVNWAAPFVVGASLISAALLVRLRSRYWVSAVAFNHVILILFFHWPFVLLTLGVEESNKNSPYFRLSGWESFSDKVHAVLVEKSRIEPTTLVSVDRNVLAYFGHYSGYNLAQLYFWNRDRSNIRNHYDLVNDLEHLRGRAAHFVSNKPISREVEESFERVRFISKVSYELSPEIQRAVYLYEVEGFKGYVDI